MFPINVWVFYISCLACALSFICPDSPRWLLVSGRKKEAIDSINCIAKYNGSDKRISYDTNFEEQLIPAKVEILNEKNCSKEKNGSYNQSKP